MMFLAYSLIVVAIWGCTSAVAIHFENPFIMVAAFLGMVLIPSFRQSSSNNKKEDDKPKIRLDIKKERKATTDAEYGRYDMHD